MLAGSQPPFTLRPIVKVFNPNSRTAVKQILAFEPTFRGGVNVAAGDVNTASATDEIVVGAGYGGGPVVRVFNADGTAYSSFFAYESSFRNGVNVAVGDLIAPTVLGGGLPGAEIATGPGEGGAPLLKVFTGTGALQRAFYAFDQAKRNGLSVAVGQTETTLPDNDIFAVEQFTPSDVTPVFRAFQPSNPGQIEAQFTPFPAGYSRYYNMAVGDVNPFNTNGNNNAGDWLGVAGEATGPNGKTIELSKETVSGVAIVTVQNRIPDMIMAPPQPIPHEATIAASDPFQFVAVQSLVFSRPAYLQVLAVVLVILVAVSAALAIFMRGLDELALGFGGIVLGVWGVRSILMPQSLGTVTAIDLALSWLILLLLLGLALRAALHFLHESELQPPTRVRRAKPRVNRAAKSSGADVTTN